MKTLTDTTINPLSPQVVEGSYEVIENELIVDSNFNGLTIAGSLFSLTTFKNVTFDSCVFFASRMENCEFVNCTFINCQFQFTNIAHCDFRYAKFDACSFDFSSIKNSKVDECWLDSKVLHNLAKDSKNEIERSFNLEGWSLDIASESLIAA